MKKLLSIILPSLLILTLEAIDHFILPADSLYLVAWIWLAFPIIFIIQGIICSNSIRNILIGFLSSAIAIIVPISVWYNVGSMTAPVITYIFLGLVSFFISRYISKKQYT